MQPQATQRVAPHDSSTHLVSIDVDLAEEVDEHADEGMRLDHARLDVRNEDGDKLQQRQTPVLLFVHLLEPLIHAQQALPLQEQHGVHSDRRAAAGRR